MTTLQRTTVNYYEPIGPSRRDVQSNSSDKSRPTPRRISSNSLLWSGNEIEIEHNGFLYRLRQTALGKLILTK